MNEHGIEELIGTLYEMVQDARSVPFSSDKCAVEREKVLDLLDEISNQLPAASSLRTQSARQRIS